MGGCWGRSLLLGLLSEKSFSLLTHYRFLLFELHPVDISGTRLHLHIGHLRHHILLGAFLGCLCVGRDEGGTLRVLALLEEWVLAIFDEVCDGRHQLHYN